MTMHFLRAACAVALIILGSAAQAQTPAEAATSPFAGMSGAWSGNGTITFGGGEKERIRCRVNYNVADTGKNVQQDLRCASDSYKFELSSDIVYANGNISGRWSETTRRKFGNLQGRVNGNQIEALAETAGFSAFLTLVTRGDRQSVTIQSKSTEISEVTISLRRGGGQ